MIAALFIKIKMQSLETGEHSDYNIFKIDPITMGVFLDPVQQIYSSWKLLNYRLSQKLKLIRNDEFNHLIIILTLPKMRGPKISLNKWGPTRGTFNIFKKEEEWRERWNLSSPGFDTMLNY